jgi:hypothetical protein
VDKGILRPAERKPQNSAILRKLARPLQCLPHRAVRRLPQLKGEFSMTNTNTYLRRALAAFGATAMSLAIMVSYFATPQVQAVSGMLA